MKLKRSSLNSRDGFDLGLGQAVSPPERLRRGTSRMLTGVRPFHLLKIYILAFFRRLRVVLL